MLSRNFLCVLEFGSVYKSCLKSRAMGLCWVSGHVGAHKPFLSSRKHSQWYPLESVDNVLTPDIDPFNRGLIKPLLFTIGFSSITFISCAIWEYENIINKSWSNKAKTVITAKTSKPGFLSRWWSNLKDSDVIFYTLLLANVLVFIAWRFDALLPYMVDYFLSNPSRANAYASMLLSTFSHYSAMHLAGNMYMLDSFLPPAVSSLGKEQFMGMYLSGAVFSNLASFAFKIWHDDPGLSLGASGAIMSVLSYVCFKNPESKLSLIFAPSVQFSAGSAIKCMMALDFLGIVMGSKVFDHSAHFGGALFGIFWCYWGSNYIWGNRHKVINVYRIFRKSNVT